MAKYGQYAYGDFLYVGLWRGAIYDRTFDDVLNRSSKAYCNVLDMRRLSDNCLALSKLLNISISANPRWLLGDFPTESDFARILGNIETLRNAYYTKPSTPDTPSNPMNSWQKWNDAEQILYDLYTLFQLSISDVIRAGEVYAGEAIGVI